MRQAGTRGGVVSEIAVKREFSRSRCGWMSTASFLLLELENWLQGTSLCVSGFWARKRWVVGSWGLAWSVRRVFELQESEDGSRYSR